MESIKKLAGQTAIYGITTIVARLLNYLLLPLHTYIFTDTSEYGVVGELFAWVALFNVILTYGMETAYFRFMQSSEKKDHVFSTVVLSLLVTSTLFGVFCTIFSQPIATKLGYEAHAEYVTWFALILSMDALSAIFFARLRQRSQPVKFAIIKTTNIVTNVIFNLFFLLLCPYCIKHNFATGFFNFFYSPDVRVGYIFVSNLIASAVTLLLFIPGCFKVKWQFDVLLWKKMIRYAMPLLVLGLAGIVNETMDRILLKKLSPQDIAQSQVGIYSACYKISILMTIFIQAFKYAAEPYFFNKSKDVDAKESYANVMRMFVLVCSILFLGVVLYLDLFQYLMGPEYRVGLGVVPILLIANLFLGIFYNLSIWYKLTDKTQFGAYIALFGAAITLGLNWLLIPIMGYMGSAWATICCYGAMMIASFLFGQKYYPVPYNLKKIGLYLVLAVVFYLISDLLAIQSLPIRLGVNSILFVGYLFIIFVVDKNYLRAQIKG